MNINLVPLYYIQMITEESDKEELSNRYLQKPFYTLSKEELNELTVKLQNDFFAVFDYELLEKHNQEIRFGTPVEAFKALRILRERDKQSILLVLELTKFIYINGNFFELERVDEAGTIASLTESLEYSIQLQANGLMYD